MTVACGEGEQAVCPAWAEEHGLSSFRNWERKGWDALRLCSRGYWAVGAVCCDTAAYGTYGAVFSFLYGVWGLGFVGGHDAVMLVHLEGHAMQ